MFIFVPGSKLLPTKQCSGNGERPWSMQNNLSLPLLPFHVFPLLWCGLYMGCSPPRKKLLQHGSPMGCRGLSAPVASPSPPSFSGLGICRAVAHSVFPSSSSACPSLLHFLKYAFPKVPPSWLRGSAVPCGGSVGDGSVWHGAARGHFAQRPPLLSPPPP